MSKLKVGLLVPHIFMQDKLMHKVIFSPGELAIFLADELVKQGVETTLFSIGKVKTKALNETIDTSFFEEELKVRGYDELTLFKKHPLLFITLARQLQTRLIAKAFGEEEKFDILHVWSNEEEIALNFSFLLKTPVVFTHHEPFNFLEKYRLNFPYFKDKNWIALSKAQMKTYRETLDVNFVDYVYHGLPKTRSCLYTKKSDYFLYMGRIIRPKGVILAIKAAKKANKKLIIAGKHYSSNKDRYWDEISKYIDQKQIKYIGFVSSYKKKMELLKKAKALLMPSLWEEPFGLVMIEAFACSTPVIGLDSGSIKEILNPRVGIIVKKQDEDKTINDLAKALEQVDNINPKYVHDYFLRNFTAELMAKRYISVYTKILQNN